MPTGALIAITWVLAHIACLAMDGRSPVVAGVAAGVGIAWMTFAASYLDNRRTP